MGVNIDTSEWKLFFKKLATLKFTQIDLFYQKAAKTLAADDHGCGNLKRGVKDGQH